MCNHHSRARRAPVPPDSRFPDIDGEPDLLALEEALNRLASLLETLEWLLIEPPREAELTHLLMTEARAELKRAVAVCAHLITEEGRGAA